MSEFTLDYETVDRITAQNLQENYEWIKKETAAAQEGEIFMHEDDIVYNLKLLKGLKRVLNYYGVTVR